MARISRASGQAILFLDPYCSITVDRVDQSAFALPHFVTKSKGVKVKAMKVELIDLLEHQKTNCLLSVTMSEEHETGAIHIIEALQQFKSDLSSRKCLPQTLYIQMDNCTRENENWYAFAHIDYHMPGSVFSTLRCLFFR